MTVIPKWGVKIGDKTVVIDAIAKWYLIHLDKSETPSPYWMYKTASDQIGYLVTNKLVRFIPGNYKSLDARLLEITTTGRSCLKALQHNDEKHKRAFMSGGR